MKKIVFAAVSLVSLSVALLATQAVSKDKTPPMSLAGEVVDIRTLEGRTSTEVKLRLGTPCVIGVGKMAPGISATVGYCHGPNKPGDYNLQILSCAPGCKLVRFGFDMNDLLSAVEIN